MKGDAALRLPPSLAETSAAFAASALLRQALGEELYASLLDSQAAEVRRCAGLSDAELLAADAWWPLVGGVGDSGGPPVRAASPGSRAAGAPRHRCPAASVPGR